jgi:hypothetical protein
VLQQQNPVFGDIGNFDLTGMFKLTKANGYHLPPMKSPFVTLKWLAKVL